MIDIGWLWYVWTVAAAVRPAVTATFLRAWGWFQNQSLSTKTIPRYFTSFPCWLDFGRRLNHGGHEYAEGYKRNCLQFPSKNRRPRCSITNRRLFFRRLRYMITEQVQWERADSRSEGQKTKPKKPSSRRINVYRSNPRYVPASPLSSPIRAYFCFWGNPDEHVGQCYENRIYISK